MSIVRLPLAVELTNREEASRGIFGTDTRLINCYIEREDGRMYVAKRPGLSAVYTYNGGAATSGQGTVYYNGSLYAVGSNVLYRLTGGYSASTDGSAWGASTSAPFFARRQHQTVVFNGQVLVLGGFSTAAGNKSLNDVWASSDLVNWTQLTAAAPWPARCRFATVILGSTLYVIGGSDGAFAFYNDVWSTQDGINWVQVVGTASWSARWGHGAVAFNNGIMLMGGHDSGTNYLNDVWFSSDGSTWTNLIVNASWSGRYRFGCIVYNNKVWVIGGNAGGTVVTSVYSSSDGIAWTNTGNLPLERQASGVVVYKNLIWIIGGYNNALTGTTTVYTTSDGASFSTPTTNYGGGTIGDEGLVVWSAPPSVTSNHAPTLWLVCGFIGGADSAQIYRATLNVSLPSSFSPATGTTTSDQWQFTTQNLGQYLILKNTVDAWVLSAGQLQKITSLNYPTSTVPGIVNLDDTVYVMGPDGTIYGTNLSDPFTWSANNYIVADYQADRGVCIARNGQNVIAFKSTSMQFFYDAGRYPGSPLLPIVSANQMVGCVAAGSVVNMDNTIVFMATTGAADRYIAMLNGTTPVKISTPAIDRILYSWTPGSDCYAQNIKTNGHDFYVITMTSIGMTLAYDFVEKCWHVWQSSYTAGNYFTGVNFVTDGTSGYVQSLTAGRLLRLDELQYIDADGGSQTINVSITLSKYDNGTNHKKFCASATIIGDRAGGATPPNNATLSWSDDDLVTFSSGQTVDLTTECPKVNRLGSFYRRVFRITHTAQNPMRLEALELDVIEG